MAPAGRLLSGALAGALLWALLSSAELALAPDEVLGLGILWVAGVGLGVWLASWWAELPRRMRSSCFVLWGALLLAPLLVSAPLVIPDLALGQTLERVFWSREPSPVGLGAWRSLLVVAGVGVGAALRSQLGLGLTGGVLGIAAALVCAASGWPALSMVAPLVGVQLLVFLMTVGRSLWRTRRLGPLASENKARDLEVRDFGWATEEPPVLRPRLGGLMLVVMLAVACVFEWMTADLFGLVETLSGSPPRDPAALLMASGLALALGCGAGRLFLALARRMSSAELAPLFLLFAATTWHTTHLSESLRVVWFQLGSWWQNTLPNPLFELGRAWEYLFWIGPSLFTAGVALFLLPRLAFSSSPDGARRSRRMVGTTLLGLGLFATTPFLELVLQHPGPASFFAGLVALAATSFFLVVDLRGQSVVPVGQRIGPGVSLLARSAAGLALGWLTWTVATVPSTAEAPFESLPGLQLARMLQAAEHSTADLTFGLADPATGQRAPFLERTEWSRGVRQRWRRGGRELDPDERAHLRVSAERLARLFGVADEPLVVSEFATFQKTELDDAPWILDLTAGGPDPRRGLVRNPYSSHLSKDAQDSPDAPPRFVCHWLPLELSDAGFELALDRLAREFPFATSWLVAGEAFVVASEFELPLDLARGQVARREAASFVGRLSAPPESLGSRERLARSSSRSVPAESLRLRARNLEQLAARRTPLPPAWGSLLGSFPEIAIGRALIDMRVAAAWVAYDRSAAPGSLALESWQRRLDGARLDAGLLAPEDAELLALDAEQRAEAALFEVRTRLLEADPRAAVSLLLSVRDTLAGRGDFEVVLAAAFELAGNRGAARLTWQELGTRGPALLSGPEHWLVELGFAPPE